MAISVKVPMSREVAGSLRAGDSCLLSGVIYTARDAAHQRLCQQLDAGQPLPFPIEDSVIYFVGPTPAKPGEVIGSAGPTTAYRMDAYSPRLIALGQRGMIGKGKRDDAVIRAMTRHGCVYFGAIGGCGALLSRCIKSARVIAYPDLGPEAIHRLEIEDFPVVVVIDTYGNNLYETGPKDYISARNEH